MVVNMKKTPNSTSATSSFSSTGFDLDAVAADDNVVYEIGGGVSHLPPKEKAATPTPSDDQQPALSPSTASTTTTTTTDDKDEKSSTQVAASAIPTSPSSPGVPPTPTTNNPRSPATDETTPSTEPPPPLSVVEEAQAAKARGNAAFVKQQYSEAYDCYTEAINLLPGYTAHDLLAQHEEWQRNQRLTMRRQLQEQDAAKRRAAAQKEKREEQQASGTDGSTNDSSNDETNNDDTTTNDDNDTTTEEATFPIPPHPHASDLAVLHCNRAAVLLAQEKYNAALRDCHVAIWWKSNYTKAHIRRARAYEGLQQTEQALQEWQAAYKLEPKQPLIQSNLKRVQALEQARMEKLKEETMGKLKDLGNTILGNFGLSLDNFQAVQDPKTGSYSISFQQNTNKK